MSKKKKARRPVPISEPISTQEKRTMQFPALQSALTAFQAKTKFITEHQGAVTDADLQHMHEQVDAAIEELQTALNSPDAVQSDETVGEEAAS